MNVMAANKAWVLVILNTFIAISSSQQEYTCPPAVSSGYMYRSSCYDFIGTEMTWTNARLQCRNRGGRLVMVTDGGMQAWLSSMASGQFPGRQGVWLGLHDRRTEGTFYWDNYDGNDQPAMYFNWASGEPNNQFGTQDCTYMRRSYGWKWVDVECSLGTFRTYSHVCEFRGILPARPTSTLLHTTSKFLSSPAAVPRLQFSSQPTTLSSLGQFTVIHRTTDLVIATTEKNSSLAGDSLDNRHDMTNYLPAQAVPYSDNEKEILHAARQSQTVYVIIAVIVILAIGVPVIVFLLVRRRRRLHQPKDGNVTPTVSYSSTGVRGLENPMYCSPNALFTDSTTSPLLDGGRSDEQQLPPSSVVSRTPAFNVYIDMDALARGSQDSLHQYESANGNPIYAEPFHDCRGTEGGSSTGEPTGRSTLLTQPPPVYAECMPPESELNDLSKDCNPDRPSSGGFGELKLNVDSNGEATASGNGGYEEYRSQWNAYENMEKPGSKPCASS